MNTKDLHLAKSMDMALMGPRLFCEWCGILEVLSPCYFCQQTGVSKKDSDYCRICGKDCSCKKEYEVCYTMEQNANFEICKDHQTKPCATNCTTPSNYFDLLNFVH